MAADLHSFWGSFHTHYTLQPKVSRCILIPPRGIVVWFIISRLLIYFLLNSRSYSHSILSHYTLQSLTHITHLHLLKDATLSTLSLVVSVAN